MQKRRAPRRKVFGPRLRAKFLEDFACTANVAASAEAAGVSPGCVFTHRRKDADFAADYWAALTQAVGKLAALRVQREIERSEGRLADGGSAGLRLDGPPDERQIADLVKLMQMLRDLCRNLSGEAAPTAGRPQHASLDEMCTALAKRLKAFPPTKAQNDNIAESPLHHQPAAGGPPPRPGEE